MSQAVKQPAAVILVSGGMDSAVTLALARHRGFQCHALSVAYGQRHAAELAAAGQLCTELGAKQHQVMRLDLSAFGGSALTDPTRPVPEHHASGIPPTYVPARNTILLALALARAETLCCDDLFIGVNAVDYSGYPDCRPEFIDAFRKLAGLATQRAIEEHPPRLHAPLQHCSKAEIVRLGLDLGVDFAATVSCYRAAPDGAACGSCDACRLRRDGFTAAGVPDPTRYRDPSST